MRMSCPYTSSQNGKAERMIRPTNDTVCTLLLQASLPARLWAESLHTSTYLHNHLPFAACPAPTPHHALFSTPSLRSPSSLWVCVLPEHHRHYSQAGSPFDSLCLPWVLPGSQGVSCYDLISHRVLISRHVVFDEFVFPFSTITTPASTSELDLSSVFPTDPVVEPPLSVFPTGTATSPVARDTSGPLPCPGPEGSPSGPAPAHDTGPGLAPLTPAPPARFAQPVRVYQRRARLVLLPPSAPVAPSSPGSPTPPVTSSLPATSTPLLRPPPTRAATSVYHPPLLHRHPRHVHPMVT